MASVIHAAAMIATASAAIASLVDVTALCFLVLGWRRRPRGLEAARVRRVTILKPLCGAEAGLDENLRSFCREAGPEVEILFGVRDDGDAALAVARQVTTEFPDVDCRVVSGVPSLGLNAKVSTLAHLVGLARYDTFVVADSDTHVTAGYLRSVVAPLADPSVGVVTCLFRSRPTPGFWSRFSALSIDEWFVPSVLVSRALHSEVYCSGPTMALRRDTLEAVGGFEALASVLADDYELGARARRLGYRNLIADCEIAVTVDEPTCGAMVQHELRWMRTVRTVAPLGHAFSFLTYAVPLAVVAALVAHAATWSLVLIGLALALRLAVHRIARQPSDGPSTGLGPRVPSWLVPVRDIVSLGIWLASYASRDILWRGQVMRVGTDGVLRRLGARRAGHRGDAAGGHSPWSTRCGARVDARRAGR